MNALVCKSWHLRRNSGTFLRTDFPSFPNALSLLHYKSCPSHHPIDHQERRSTCYEIRIISMAYLVPWHQRTTSIATYLIISFAPRTLPHPTKLTSLCTVVTAFKSLWW